jgi:hypothetical protein
LVSTIKLYKWRSRRIFWNWWVWSRKKPGIFFHDAWNEYALVLPERQKSV